MGLECVAEGVERDEELEVLMGLGCTLVQGYLLSKPMPLDETGRWLCKSWKRGSMELPRETGALRADS